jgi:hypothetical protein
MVMEKASVIFNLGLRTSIEVTESQQQFVTFLFPSLPYLQNPDSGYRA